MRQQGTNISQLVLTTHTLCTDCGHRVSRRPAVNEPCEEVGTMQIKRRHSVACILGLAVLCAMQATRGSATVELNAEEQASLVGGITWKGQCAYGGSTCMKCISQTCDEEWETVVGPLVSGLIGCNLSAAPAGGCVSGGVLSFCITRDFSCSGLTFTLCGGGSVPGPIAPRSCVELYYVDIGYYADSCWKGGTQSCVPTTGYAPCKSVIVHRPD